MLIILQNSRSLVCGLLLLLGLVGGCNNKKEEVLEPLDSTSGAPLTKLGCGAFRTFTQAQWDQPATAAPGPGTYLDRHFSAIFFNAKVDGLVVGIVQEPGYQYLRFSSVAAVQSFLPQLDKAMALTRSAEDPPAGAAFSALAGEVVALKLNLYYDDYERSRTRLRSGLELRHLVVASGVFQGLDVSRLLATAERTLGGDPTRTVTYKLFTGPTRTYTFTLDELYQAIELTNQNFAGGTIDRGYLTCW